MSKKIIRNYIVKVANEPELKFPTLRSARDHVRSLINIHEVKGIDVLIEIYKEVMHRRKINVVKTKADNTGDVNKVFGGF